MHQQLQATVVQHLLVRELVLLLADGTVLATAQPDSARLGLPLPAGFVDSVLALPTPQLVASPPLVSFASSERVIYLARAVALAPDGGRAVRALAVASAGVASCRPDGHGVDIDGVSRC
jgi:hypothetical protein